MTRRFDESQFSTAADAVAQPGVSLPGFVACPVSAPPTTLQLWQAMYQYAFAQAITKALADLQPTRYQRLLWQVCPN